MSDKCPYCYADLCNCDYCEGESKPVPFKLYLCGSEMDKTGELYQAWACKQLIRQAKQLTQTQERLAEAERLVSGLLTMAEEAMAIWGFAASHGVGLVDAETAQVKDELKQAARAFLSTKEKHP